MLHKNLWYRLRAGLTLPTTLLVLVGLTLMLSTSPAFAKKAKFDHDTTGFILSGSHQRVSCETCHTRGIFKGTPKQCEACHARDSQMGATKKHANHIQSSNSCDDCHTEISFSDAAVDHSNVTGSCVACHNGTTATGKTINHVKSNNTCDNCHSTRAWTPARFDHTDVTEACSTCHNGVTARGKSGNHVQSSNNCGDCHTTSSWNADFLHPNVTTGCFTCHNGSTSGQKKSTSHVQSSNVCEDCHTGAPFQSWTSGVAFTHPNVTAGCFTCHDGSTTGQKKSASHIQSSNNCEDCHSGAPFKSWTSGVTFTHPNVTTGCFTCHNGSTTGQKKSTSHVQSSNTCEECHTGAPFKSWTTGVFFTHPNVTTGCFTCHDGSTTGQKKSASHIQSSNTCEECHSSTGFVSWTSGVTFTHPNVTTGCFTCHNGSTTGQKKSASHVPSSNVCEDCHSDAPYKSWTSGVTFTHPNVTTGCFTCHNGSTTGQKKSASHVPSSNVCEDCHSDAPYKSWTSGVTFLHPNVTTGCFTCHNGSTTGQKKSASHVQSSNVCEDCHSDAPYKSWTSGVTFTHPNVTTGCFTCHNGSTSGQMKSASHVPSSNICEDCHTSTTYTSWLGVNIHAGVTNNCYSCHNGTSATAIGKNAAPTLHVPSSNICEDCHKNFTSFKGAKYDHSGVATCAQCHLTDAPGGSHSTSTKCENCHTFSPKSWLVITFVHSDVATPGSCLDCHRNDKNPGHFVTTLVCDSCHSPSGTWKSKVTYDHGSANYPGDHGGNISRCTQCHTSNSQTVAYTNRSTYAPACAGCHAGDYETGPHTKYLNTKYTVSELRDCAGSCHEYTDATLNTIRRTRNSEHRPSGGF